MQPSALNILKHCTGPLRVGANLPKLPKTKDNEEGIEAHTTLEEMSLYREVSTKDIGMQSTIREVADYIKDISQGCNVDVEMKLDLSFIEEGMTGIVDQKWMDHEQRMLTIFDLKYGHTRVEAEDNWQLLAYAVPDAIQYGPDKVRLIIHQPRLPEPVRVATYHINEFWDKIQTIKNTIAIAKSDQAICTAGAHCRKCDALWSCDTASRHIIEGMKTVDLPRVEDLDNLAAKYSFFREVRKLADKKETQLKSIIETKVRCGERVQHVQMIQEKGKLVWTKDPELLKGLLPESCFKTSPLTPTQVRNLKLIPRGILETISKRGSKTSLKIMTQEEIRKCLEP